MIELSPHRTEWAAAFRHEAARLSDVLHGRVDAIEHIGSTAVPGLVAKPIVDLAARATAAGDPFALGPLLAGLGYEPNAAGPKTHAVYVRSEGARRTHILHVFDSDAWEHCNQRLFRDKLLHDAAARHRYGALKHRLAATDDGRAYTAAKLPLIEELLNEERTSRGLPPTTAWDK
ncbi:GrpB family protein [Plantibacter sp. ME-Dv--P-122b]|uniref:GrpB family protein n=1 Tax=Plantibacter sp. ME-Dv--P-122b TaxID=3040300 RepID=UPI002549F809|nr:GrpB family protein [Plantibacter sp. ME-Dv--P-122b]